MAKLCVRSTPFFYLRAKHVILFATLTEYCPKQWHSIILYSNEVLCCWQTVSCSLSSNCRQSLLPHVFMIDLWVRSQDAWLCHRGTLSWILYILPVHKEWNHDLAYFGFWGQDHQKIQTFFLIFRWRPQTLPHRNATQGKISSGSDFILEPCDPHSHSWLDRGLGNQNCFRQFLAFIMILHRLNELL